MFVENYRLDTMIGGQAQTVIPYPKISEQDWHIWKAFLPVKSAPFGKKVLLHETKNSLRGVYGMPFEVYHEMTWGADYIEDMEVWGKQEMYKDPIADGIARNGDRHLICRWGMDKLIPFDSIKNRSLLYHIHNFGVNLLTSEMFWLTSAVVTVFGMALTALW